MTTAIEWASRVRAQTFNGLQTFADGISVSGTATISGDVLFSGSVAFGTATFDGNGDIAVGGSIRAGATATTPSDGHIRLTGGIGLGTATQPAAGSINITGSYLVNGAAAPTKSALAFTSGDVTVGVAATTYLGQGGENQTLGNQYWRVPFDCTLRNMFTESAAGTPGGATEKFQYMLMLVSSVSALSCTTSSTEARSSDTSNVVTATQGTQVHVRLITSPLATVLRHNVSMELRPL